MSGMDVTRRQFLLAGLGTSAMLLTGCGPSAISTVAPADQLPGTPWPDANARPDASGRAYRPKWQSTSDPMPGEVIPRSRWAKANPILGRINPMAGISAITIHHEGATNSPVYFSDIKATARRLEQIRKVHLDRMTAADIGYHYVIDRAGRVWEGRPLMYQGAHVKHHNEHNIGVMVLGNFDIQSPSNAQLNSLRSTVQTLRRRYRVEMKAIRTHQEIAPTACPGKMLQPKIVSLRSNRAFA